MRRSRLEPMPAKFAPLAQYNGRVAEGISHTAEMHAQMAALQQEFDDWRNDEMVRLIGPEYEPGSGVYVRRKPLKRKRRALARLFGRMTP